MIVVVLDDGIMNTNTRHNNQPDKCRMRRDGNLNTRRDGGRAGPGGGDDGHGITNKRHDGTTTRITIFVTVTIFVTRTRDGTYNI